jgi:hypothetical protein
MARQVVASLGYALMKLIGCVTFSFVLAPLLPLQTNQLTLRSGWIDLPVFLDCCGLRMPHSNLIDTISLRGFPSAYLPSLFNLSKRDTLRNNRKKGFNRVF